MPTYDYRCTACGARFEAWQKFTDEPIRVCPTCSGPAQRVIHAPAITFKGSGFYSTDSKAAAAAAIAGETSSASAEAAPKAGESAKAGGESAASAPTSPASSATPASQAPSPAPAKPTPAPATKAS